MTSGYTHQINFYKNVNGLGWVASFVKTTQDALANHLNGLSMKSNVRCIDVVELK